MATNPREEGAGSSTPEAEDEGKDEIEKSMGVFGRWHLLMVLAIYLVKFPIAWHCITHVFLAPKVVFYCNGKQDECGKNCNHTFNKTIFTRTIVTQFDLVCERRILGTLDQTIAMLGIMVGSVAFGYLADKFGRKPPFAGAALLQAALGISSAFAPWYSLFLVLRFLTTFTVGGSLVISFVLIMELVGTKWRTRMGVLYQIPFNLGHLTLPLFAYFIRDWRYLMVALSVPSFILISYFWIVPESPRWLLAAERKDQAVKVLEKAARCNKLPTENIRKNVDQYLEKRSAEVKKRGNYCDLFRTPIMRVYTICIAYNWLVCGMCFYGGAQHISQLGGNIFINQAIAAVVQIPGTLFALWATKALGRRWTLIFADVMSATCCLLIAFLPSNPKWLKIIFAGGNMFALMTAFNTVYIFSGELFPTVVRNAGVGLCSMCARWGSMVAPFIADAEDLGRISSWVAPLIFACVASIGAGLAFFLPETLDCKLPDTVKEAEEHKNNPKKVKHK